MDPEELESSGVKEGEPTLFPSRFPQSDAGVILVFGFRIRRDCVRTCLNSAFKTADIVVGFALN